MLQEIIIIGDKSMIKEYDFIFLEDKNLPFLMASLKGMLDAKDYRTEKCDVDMSQLGSLMKFPKVFLVDAEVLNCNSNAKVYLTDLCLEKDIKMVLFGEPNEINQITRMTLANVVIATFPRPINNNDVLVKLGDLILAINSKNMQKKILVIDDSASFLRLIMGCLEGEYQVEVCPSATAAFHMIEKNRPDLILLDYEMPICNGAQFLEMIHSEPAFSDIPVIFLTSKDDAETVREVVSLKPQGYLLKTLPMEKIVASVREFFLKEGYK